ncbi:S-layer homology domain-containing protein [Candidatus Peregrinibacteria bacterium]|nr:MAG: S-layer homology domain-containing protein [Candidatus Peregrinibacteria bacterium]
MKIRQSLLAAVVLSFVSAPLSYADFSDVSASNTHYAAITSLVEQDILQGYSDGTFKPDQEVNRAEALKMFLMGMGVAPQTGVELNFSDVESDAWYAEWVGSAVQEGIVSGYSDGTFKPEQSVNRAEAMKMLTLAAGLTASSPNSSPFLDVSTDVWFASYAALAKEKNVITPQTDGLWHGEAALSRAEIAEMVYRLQVSNAEGRPYDEARHWLRVDFPTVNITLKVPFEWGYKQEGVGAVFLLDSAHGQVSLLTPYENGGSLLMTRYANHEGQSAEELFDSVALNSSWPTRRTEVSGHEALIVEHEDGLFYKEWYVYLPNETLVNLVALRGDGAYGPYLEAHMEAMVMSLEYSTSGATNQTLDEIVEDLRAAIQVDGVGMDMMALLSDWELFETDSIGVGTGPVDYYYSPSAQLTIKYERSYDVLLDIRDGKTSAF